MPTIILKKTFSSQPGITVSYHKSFSFHGASVDDLLIQTVNQKLRTLHYVTESNVPVFKMDTYHHYKATMNHTCQKHSEEDIVAAIIDVMEILGWTFRFEYDASHRSDQMMKIGGSTETSKELFIFQKPPGSAAAMAVPTTQHIIGNAVPVTATQQSISSTGVVTKTHQSAAEARGRLRG